MLVKEPKYYQDCDNCKFACKIDGLCDWHMNPDYKEGDKLYCEVGRESIHAKVDKK